MADTCFVCNGKMSDYFVKHESYAEFGKSIDRRFMKCEHCGLVIDQTSYGMSPEERSMVNDVMLHDSYEHAVQNEANIRENNRIKRQSLFVYQTLRTGVIRSDARIVDYGCATGELVRYVEQLREAHNDILPRVFPYDRYYKGGGISL